ncbi:hypothetical protein PP940_gp214 [Rhizobium phage RL2RES]|uniref:Uncharacterized protein n=1 Tax=Rhizobium phage RL2RES TaxID=103371 RepID=A0A6B9J452_9CAUD|nr:hypothetical protein PP940_gp214 [Rhizobium phage RL2RES]QGZ14228.1 hypothetical protein RL2RES_214 [Rhizobium phage RL2RES]
MYMVRPRPEGTITHYSEIEKGDKLYYVIGSCNSDVGAVEILDLVETKKEGGSFFKAIELDVQTLEPKISQYHKGHIKSEHHVYDRNLDPECERERYNDNFFYRKKEDAEKARDFFRSNYERKYY